MQPTGPTALIILDGFGLSNNKNNNAIAQAHTPHLKKWFKQCSSALLQASGSYVGLPAGCLGNSQVGHLTIGSGRIIKQPITYINESIDNKTFYGHTVLKKALAQIKAATGRLHIMGLCSDANVHSDIKQVYAYLQAAQSAGIQQVFLHLFLDGRDTPPRSASKYLTHLSAMLVQNAYGTIGSLHGRFYAMDRDRNFERTKKSYDVLIGSTQIIDRSWQQVLTDSYANSITDEFIEPVLLHQDAAILPGDGVLFFNVRPDRARQLTRSLIDPSFTDFVTQPLSLSCFVTPVDYGLSVATQVLFRGNPVLNTLKDVLCVAHKSMFVIAETEKYAHVTYFFNGMREQSVVGETRVLIPSLKLKTYAEQPCMSAPDITQAVIATLQKPYDFYLINYANADMVGHSGDLIATIKAIECLDVLLGLLYDALVTQHNGTLYITADHGKAEEMFDAEAQQPKTSHTINPVPFLVVTKDPVPDGCDKQLPLHQLADIAPYILKCMGLPVPIEMQG